MSFQKKKKLKQKIENSSSIIFCLNHNIEHDGKTLFGFIDFVITEFSKKKVKISHLWHMLLMTYKNNFASAKLFCGSRKDFK